MISILGALAIATVISLIGLAYNVDRANRYVHTNDAFRYMHNQAAGAFFVAFLVCLALLVARLIL